jgi:hypothetical protein
VAKDALIDIVNALRAGHPDEAVRTLRRQAPGGRDTSVLLQSLVRGALHGLQCLHAARRAPGADAAVAPEPAWPGSRTASTFGDDAPRPTVHEEDRGPVIPLRLGLRLLTETSAERLAQASQGDASRGPEGDARRMGAEPRESHWLGTPTGLAAFSWFGGAEDVESRGPAAASWGAAMPGGTASAALNAATADRARRGLGACGVAVFCIVLAAAAALTGYPVIAVALGVGASWLALRRIGAGSPSRPHDAAGAESARDGGRRTARDAAHAGDTADGKGPSR